MAYVQLGDICNVIKGEIGITKAIPGDFPMVTTSEHRKSHNKFQLDTEAVLVPLVSATGHGHASIKRVHYQEGKFAFGSILAACVPKDENYSAKFLYIYFNLMKDYVLVPLMKGSANVSLTLGNLKKAKVPNITLQTQLEIVELYSEIKIEQDKITDLLIKQEADINSLRQAILQEAVQGKLTADWRQQQSLSGADVEDANQLLKRIQEEKAQLIADKKIKKEKALPKITDDEIPYELPEGWVWCRLGDISSIRVGATPKREVPEYWNGNIPWVSSGEVANNFILDTKEKITEKGFSESSVTIYPAGTVLVAMIGQGKTRGQTSILKINAGTNQNVGGIIIFHNYLISEYLWYYFLGRYEKTRSNAVGGNQPAINGTKLKMSIFGLPPLKEQKAIVEKVNALMALCDALEQEVQQSHAHSEQLMQSVLREVFEGERKAVEV